MIFFLIILFLCSLFFFISLSQRTKSNSTEILARLLFKKFRSRDKIKCVCFCVVVQINANTYTTQRIHFIFLKKINILFIL